MCAHYDVKIDFKVSRESLYSEFDDKILVAKNQYIYQSKNNIGCELLIKPLNLGRIREQK